MLESSVVFLPRVLGTESRNRSPLGAYPYRSVPMKYASCTRPRREASLAPPPRPPSPARSPSRTRRALWGLAPLFARRTDPGYGATHCRAAHREPRHYLYVLAAVPEGEVGTLSEVIFEQLPCLLVELRGRAGSLLRGQGFSAPCPVYISFDRGEAHGEGAGSPWALDIPPPTAKTILCLRSSE